MVKSQASSEFMLKGTVGADGLCKFGYPFYSNSNMNVNKFETNMVYIIGALPTTFGTINDMKIMLLYCYSHPSISNSAYQLWHARFGNPHHESLEEVLKFCNIPAPTKASIDF